MDFWAWIPNIILGVIFGFLGQMVRGLTTLKKIREEARALDVDAGELIDTKQYFYTVGIGILAGILATFSVDLNKITPQTVLAIFAAGYSGTDFIVGLFKKKSPTVDQAKRFGRYNLVIDPETQKVIARTT